MLSPSSLLLRPPPKPGHRRLSSLSPPSLPHSLSFLSPPPPPSSLLLHSLSSSAADATTAAAGTRLDQQNLLKIAIIGFGNYGQFLAKTLTSQGHTVLAHSRSDHSVAAAALGVSFFRDPHDLCEQHPDVIILSPSIISTESVLISLPLQSLKRSTLFVDVLSVKEFSRNLLLQILPVDFDILCTHPMFGPQSARKQHGWRDLHFVYENVRIGDDELRIERCERFLDIFRRAGCRMVEMGCVEHDRYAAGSQFITHTVGRVLGMLRLESTPINTKGYESLLELVENTEGDSFDLYYGLFVYNKNALEMLERLDLAFEALRMHLFGRLHEVVRKQLFGNGSPGVYANGHGVASGVGDLIALR